MVRIQSPSRIRIVLSLALLPSLVALGCSDSASGPEDEGELVSFDRLDGFFPAVYSGLESPENMVIRSQDDWSRFWDRFQPGNQRVAPPDVDFQDQMVAVLALGTRSTGGYTVEVAQVRMREDGSLLVRANESIPGENCGVTQGLTQPVDAILVSRSEAQVQFEIEDRVYGCGTDYEP